MLRRLFVLVATILSLTALVPAEKVLPGDMQSRVPELVAFHEVIAPIWHNAYPNKDYAALRSYVGQINDLFAKLEKASLPGILRDKQKAWDDKLAGLKKAVEAYNQAAAGKDDPALLSAAEALHSGFEQMVRVMRPVTRELDAFHKELYVVYHSYLPEKQLDGIKGAVAGLKAKAEAVYKATLPEWLSEKESAYRPAAKELLDKVTALELICQTGKGITIEQAVEAMHSSYKKLEGVF